MLALTLLLVGVCCLGGLARAQGPASSAASGPRSSSSPSSPSSPTSPRSRFQPTPSGEEAIPLSLAQSLATALRRHPALVRSGLKALMARAGVERATSAFGTFLEAALSAQRLVRRIETSFVAGQSEEVILGQSLGLSHRLELGTELRLALESGYRRSLTPGFGGAVSFRIEGDGCSPDAPDKCLIIMERQRARSEVVTVGPNLMGRLSLSLTQPLWRGRGEDRATGELQVARSGLDLVERQRLVELEKVLARVETAYWDLVVAQLEVGIRSAAMRQAGKELDRVEALARMGRTGGDLLSLSNARFSLAQQEMELSLSRTRSRSAQIELLGLMVQEWEPDLRVRPSDAPLPPARPGPIQEEVQACLSHNSALAVLRAHVDQARLQRAVAKDEARPDLSLRLSLATAGLGGELDDTASQMGRLDNPEALAELVLSVPLGDGPADAVLRERSLALQESELDLVQSQRDLGRQVVEAVSALEMGFRQLDLARQACRLSRQRVAASEARLAAGVGDNFVLLQAREDRVQAELAEVQVVIDLLEYRVILDHLRGDLPARHAPVVEDLSGEASALPDGLGSRPGAAP